MKDGKKLFVCLLINLEGLAAKLRRRRANHGFGTDPQQSDGTDDRIDHTATPDHKTSADQTADIDQM